MTRHERPEDIERDLAARREALALTLDRLEARVAPDRLVEAGAAAMAREGERLATAALDKARRNPVAVAMVAGGLAWLAFGPDPTPGRGVRGARRGTPAAAPGLPAPPVAPRAPAHPVRPEPEAGRPATAPDRPRPAPAAAGRAPAGR